MRVSAIPGRSDYQNELRFAGMDYVDMPVEANGKRSILTYWEERNYVELDNTETDLLGAISAELFQMLIEGGDYVIERLKEELKLTDHSRRTFARLFGIPAAALQAVIDTWDDDHPRRYSPSIYGRFDLSPVLRDGRIVGAKMLEFNAQTATGMPETDFQHQWMLANFPAEDHPDLGQWSNLFEELVVVWWREIGRYLARAGKDRLDILHFAFSSEDTSGEDRLNTNFQAAAAQYAGRLMRRIDEARSASSDPQSFDAEVYAEALLSEPTWPEVLQQYECPFRVKVFYIEDLLEEEYDPPRSPTTHSTSLITAVNLDNLITLDQAAVKSVALHDPEQEPIELIFALEPWEHMLERPLGPRVMRNTVQYDGVMLHVGLERRHYTTWIEPPYKLLWTKAILPVLWHLFKDDPVKSRYLLASYFDDNAAPDELRPPRGFSSDHHVRKPMFGREGKGVVVVENGTVRETELGHPAIARDQIILQEFTPLPEFDTLYGRMQLVLGVFMASDKAAGLLIRASEGGITTDTCKFFCHVIEMGK